MTQVSKVSSRGETLDKTSSALIRLITGPESCKSVSPWALKIISNPAESLLENYWNVYDIHRQGRIQVWIQVQGCT